MEWDPTSQFHHQKCGRVSTNGIDDKLDEVERSQDLTVMISKGRRPQKGFHFGDSVGDSVGCLESPDFIIRIRTQTTNNTIDCDISKIINIYHWGYIYKSLYINRFTHQLLNRSWRSRALATLATLKRRNPKAESAKTRFVCCRAKRGAHGSEMEPGSPSWSSSHLVSYPNYK